MPIQITATSQAGVASSPSVTAEFVVHFPEEVVAEAVAAERDGQLLVVACRDAAQAQTLSALLLAAGVGSAVIDGRTSGFDVRQTLEAFGYQDFTVLLAADDVLTAWQAPDTCRRLLHADLPALPGTRQFLLAARTRQDRVPGAVQVSQVA